MFVDIQSWWEVPSIAHFCSLFRDAFNLLDFDIEVPKLPKPDAISYIRQSLASSPQAAVIAFAKKSSLYMHLYSQLLSA